MKNSNKDVPLYKKSINFHFRQHINRQHPVLVIGDKCEQGYADFMQDTLRGHIEADLTDAQKATAAENKKAIRDMDGYCDGYWYCYRYNYCYCKNCT